MYKARMNYMYKFSCTNVYLCVLSSSQVAVYVHKR